MSHRHAEIKHNLREGASPQPGGPWGALGWEKLHLVPRMGWPNLLVLFPIEKHVGEKEATL